MGKEITYNPNKPDVMTVKGCGRIEYMEFENDIYIAEIYADKRGYGIKLMREFIKYARSVRKSIYGRIDPNQKGEVTITPEKLVRLYTILGAKPFGEMGGKATMKLEIT